MRPAIVHKIVRIRKGSVISGLFLLAATLATQFFVRAERAAAFPAFVEIKGKTADFSRDIQPIFNSYCVACHGPDMQQKGLRLDSAEAVLKGSATGKVVVSGNSGGSPLIRRLTGLDKPPMPFGGQGNGAQFSPTDWILDPSSPMMAGVPNPITGNYASHVSYTGLPGAVHVVVTSFDQNGPPVIYDLQAGGTCASPTPTPTATRTPTATATPAATRTPTASPTPTGVRLAMRSSKAAACTRVFPVAPKRRETETS